MKPKSGPPIELASETLHIHIVGIGGSGMRAIAKVLIEMGHQVSGSDMAATRYTSALETLGATVYIGHCATQIADADIITYSTAIPKNNPERSAAQESAKPTLSRSQILQAITKCAKSVILVAGTHGKTTTSSMLVSALEGCGANPSFILGADHANYQTGARWVDGSVMVVEADESDGTFLNLDGDAAVVTSLDPDHLDYYRSNENLEQAFVDFVTSIDGPVAICSEPGHARNLYERVVSENNPSTDGHERLEMLDYSTRAEAALQIESLGTGAGSTQKLRAKIKPNVTTKAAADVSGTHEVLFELALPGLHNILNAAGALTVATAMGYEVSESASGLTAYKGISRRFEHVGTVEGVEIYDDYAHLPAEASAAIEAGVSLKAQRLIVAFQPHRYSRTRDIGPEFATSFNNADLVYITEIYPAGEKPITGISGKNIYRDVSQERKKIWAELNRGETYWAKDLEELTEMLTVQSRSGDVILTLGAGDVTELGPRLISALGKDFKDDHD